MTLAGDLVASWGDAKSCSEEHDFKHSLNKSVTERSQMPGKQVVCRHNVYWRCDILENDKRSFRFEPFLDFIHDNIISQSHWYCQTQKLVLETPYRLDSIPLKTEEMKIVDARALDARKTPL